LSGLVDSQNGMRLESVAFSVAFFWRLSVPSIVPSVWLFRDTLTRDEWGTGMQREEEAGGEPLVGSARSLSQIARR